MNGLVDLKNVMRKGPLEQGDVIILTKALVQVRCLQQDMHVAKLEEDGARGH